MSRKSESVYRAEALEIDNIKQLLHSQCGRRSPLDNDDRCKRNCRFLDANQDAMIRKLYVFRSALWLENSNPSSRRALLIARLFDASVKKSEDGKRKLVYRIDNANVCRNFFFQATYFEARLFNDCCNDVINAGDVLAQSVMIGKDEEHNKLRLTRENEETVLMFLDEFFSSNTLLDNKGIDHDPAKSEKKTTRLHWSEIYFKLYVPFCENNSPPVSYPRFCALRKRFRPNYVRDRRTGARGWNHLGCHDCDKFKLFINEAKKTRDLSKLADLNARYNAHLDEQDVYRRQYKVRGIKGQTRAPLYGSAIVDATSSLGASFIPHVGKQVKGEPERNQLLKMKSTFTRVHGVGTLIVQSFPDLEKQGSNLILECCLEAILVYLKHHKVEFIDTFYIQLDNTSVNKAWTLIAGLAALTLAGIVRKVLQFIF